MGMGFFFFWSDKNAKVMMIVYLCEWIKNHRIIHFFKDKLCLKLL